MTFRTPGGSFHEAVVWMGIPKQRRHRVISGVMQMTTFLFLNSYKKCVSVSIRKHNRHTKPVIPWLLSQDESKTGNRKPQILAKWERAKIMTVVHSDTGHMTPVLLLSPPRRPEGCWSRAGWRLSNKNTVWIKELNGGGERGLPWRTGVSVQFALHISRQLSNLRIYS